MNQNKKPKSYESAMKKAWEGLAALDSIEVARKSGASYDPGKEEFRLVFLGNEYSIQASKKSVQDPARHDVKPFMAVLLLHYLIFAKDIGLEGKLISFRELRGGAVYYNAFQRRAQLPITETFGDNPGALRAAGEHIQATDRNHGDISIEIVVFPKVPVTVIIWEGDEEIPPSSNMLFDASIKELLPTEDVAVIGGFVASALVKNKPNSHAI